MSNAYKLAASKFSTSFKSFKVDRLNKSVLHNLLPKYGVYDVVLNETPYTICAFKDQDGSLFKQAFAHKDFSPEGARYKAQRFYNQYLASCAEDEMYY